MRRMSIVIWIVVGVFAAAVLAAVAIVFYHVGFDHGATTGAVTRVRLPLRSGIAIGFPRRFGGGGVGVFLALLAAGGIGALIVYLVTSGRQGAVVASVPAPAAQGGPYDPRRQQFEQWQQFEEWHRQTHGAAAPQAPAAPWQAPVATQSEPPTMAAPNVAAPDAAAPDAPPAAPEPPTQGV